MGAIQMIHKGAVGSFGNGQLVEPIIVYEEEKGKSQKGRENKK